MAYRQDLFTHAVASLRSGRTQQEASEKLNELVNICRDTGKAGKLTLEIAINPDKGLNGQYFISDKITVKKPEFPRGQTILYGTADGNLQINDPNQTELDLTIVKDQERKTVVIDNESSEAIQL